jgi:predicted DNA-binding protein with PD1-like motif
MVDKKRCSAGIWMTCLTILIFSACQSRTMKEEKTTTYAFRLKPGDDLRGGIEKLVKEKDIKAGWVVTCAGSLTDYAIRFANQPGGTTGTGHFEIVSLGGTVSTNGSHLHISISDSTGKTIGGHLLPGCRVYTTAEIVVQASGNYEFTREKDGTTPWEELQVKEIRNKE